MKQFNKYNYKVLALTFIVSLFVFACTEDDLIDPTGDFTYEVSAENPLLVAFEATATDGITLAWDFGDGGASIAMRPEHTYSAGGTYTVTMTIFGEEGSSPAEVSKSVTVVENPTASFSYEVNEKEVSFTSTTTATVSLSWDFGDGGTSTEANPTYTYADYGDYTVTLTANGAAGSTPAVVEKTVSVTEEVKVFEPVTVENADFALPGSGKQQNWSAVPGWASDSGASDSGVEAGGWWDTVSDNYRGYMKSSDPSVYNLTDHTIAEGEEILLNVDAFDIWNGPKFTATLYYNSGDGVRNVIATQTFNLVASQWNAIELSATATAESVGAKLGIEISTQSGDGGDGWTGFDDIQLFVK